ncbi:protein FAM3D isoform X2 [Sapajus apella]|uniref:Protein FAM3D isoform X2 n=1 Tax=Sapajus apella TaxID=9515 RepID=A0A6J3IUU7_SAPAP|nr:protein FAM3D isoform X2 [Sapajus apella]
MRVSGVFRVLALIFATVTTWIIIRNHMGFSIKTIRLPRWLGSSTKETQVMKHKCGLIKPCSANYFAFKIGSGAANVVGPTMCFENHIIMSPVKNNVGRGLNIALVNDIKHLVKFLKEIPEGALVLVASYDDPGTKMNDEARKLFANLGSSYAKQLGFRDSWVFVGAKNLRDKSPFEQFLKNNPKTNKYEGWPELLEMEGCVPARLF